MVVRSDRAASPARILSGRIKKNIGPVFRDYILGLLTAVETDDPRTPSLWRDESSGEVLESRQHLISFILNWAIEYCVDDEGLIPVLDFSNVLAYVFGRKIEEERPDDTKLRKPFQFPLT